LPIWECEECGHFEVIGDERELEERAVSGWEAFEGHTPHKPWIDEVHIECSECGVEVERIPDVGNPWLDAGIVSFSTLRYRTDRDYWRKWYPADWISESFPGQFRNWFYSLLAMATVMDDSPPFKTCFSYALLLAEDGREMHKSWGNAIEFNEAADEMGVDVMRWLYCAHKPEKNLLFGYSRADEVRRQFLIPFWNVYDFFVTYANIDEWEPDVHWAEVEPLQATLLDRWMLARLNQLVAKASERLDNYDAYAMTMVVEEFLDDLSNWYVRRSRRRFWKSEQDADKYAAYATLYRVLTTLIRLLAPVLPFVTEAMYQNLVRSVDENTLVSVHHTLWPKVDLEKVDEELLAQMALAREVVTQGHSARNSQGVKLRQPLSRALVYLEPGTEELSEELVDLVQDELNVKEVVFVEDLSDLITYRLLPDSQKLGPRFRDRFPAVKAVLESLEDPVQAARRLHADLPIEVEVEGESIEFAPDEILVREESCEGLAVASEHGVSVALDVELTQDLIAEGLARDVVRRVQSLRKEADFDLDDRIVTTYQTEEDLAEAIEAWHDYIAAETLSVELKQGSPTEDKADAIGEDQVEGYWLKLGVRKA
jgi:isoleucyl-tRNA synthetase